MNPSENTTACLFLFWRLRAFRKTFLFMGFLFVLVGFGGCAGNAAKGAGTKGSLGFSPLRWYPVDQYIIQIGDELDVKVFGYPELTQSHFVRPDGKIFAELVGDAQAYGLTPAELDTLLTKAYREKITCPEVAVIMRSFGGRTVFVGGTVHIPGEVPILGRLTAFQAILCAGGVTEEAKLGSVVLVRSFGKDESEIRKVNLSRTAVTGKGDFLLQPYDILFVPQTTIAKLDHFVEEYINGIVPTVFRANLGYTIDVNPESGADVAEEIFGTP